MTKLKTVSIQNGQLQFKNKIDATPEETRRDGNVTVVTGGNPGSPAFYAINFFISTTWESEGGEIYNSFGLECVVPEKNDNAPYRAVEDQGARQIAPMLRAIADEIEANFLLPPGKQGESNS